MNKRKGKSQIENLTPDHKPLECKGQMGFNWGMLCPFGKMFLRDISYCPRIFKAIYFEKNMSVQSFGTLRVPILGFPLGNPEE
jgi:hypothetical protein